MADRKLVVTFAPRLWEAFWATLVLLVGLGELAVAGAQAFYKPVTTIDCDRTHCHVSSPSLLAGTSEYTLDVAGLSGSEVVSERGEQTWIVQSKGKAISLGNPTTNDELIAQYKKHASDLQTFLTDPKQSAFSASFAGLGGPGPWLFLILGVLVLAWGIKWRRGWKAELVFDDAAGHLTIRQRPWKRTRTIPLADIGGVAATDRVAQSLYGTFRWERIDITDRKSTPIWRYRTMFTRKTAEHVKHEVEAMRDFLMRRAS